jgi:two-component system sensor histidine kinase KdpD
MIDERPDPDHLLRQIQAEEREASSARLKIFFGPYPGVGKTYAMLQAAQERRRAGVDVVIGIVETHGRPETAALVKDFEILPRRETAYKGITLKEFDLDAALARKPQLIVIDELAHTNSFGSRHEKRWQDVEELLNSGISVYTTLNVQHWESLNDIVAQITGVKVRETVPDSFLEKAHEVELVDLPPPDLLKRMEEGKVYIGDQAIRAAENFFQVGNLIALRELALWHTAERVDVQMQEFKRRYAISKVLPVRDRLLVGITASPHSARLVRSTLRLATRLRCDWITIYVQTPEHEKLPPDQKARIIDTLRLAEQLGGETAILIGQNVAEELLKYAANRNVTKIVLGKPSEPRWKEFLFGSTVNEIARKSAEIDLYVISAHDVPDEKPKTYSALEKPKRRGFIPASILVGLCTIFSHLMVNQLDRTNLLMLYLLAVLWIAYRYGRSAGIFASILSVLLFDFFIVPPYFTFAVSDTQYIITFAVMLLVAVLISTLTGRLFSLVEATRAREARLRSLYKVSQILAENPDPDEMLKLVAQEMEQLFHGPVLLLIGDSPDKLKVSAGDQTFGYSGNEPQTAQWVYQHGELAGRGSNTLAGSQATYFPLKGRNKTVGVLGIRLREEPGLIEPEQLQLLEKLAMEIGTALESKELSEAAGRATASMEAERLKNFVLRSFSYDLAQPSQEISDLAQEISRNPESQSTGFRHAIRVLIEKSNQISRVVARLPQFLQDIFPSVEETNLNESFSENPSSIEHVLTQERILFFPHDTPLPRILETLVQKLNLKNPTATLRAIQEREEAGGILLRPNFAIPHITVASFKGVIASLGIQRSDESGSGPRFWLLFVSGEDSIKEHLAFLKSVAQVLSDETLELLSKAETADRVWRILTRNDQLQEA